MDRGGGPRSDRCRARSARPPLALAERRAQRARGDGRRRRADAAGFRAAFLGDTLVAVDGLKRVGVDRYAGMTRRVCDAVVIGSGPYGLAAAAHLRAAGVDARVFGRAMDFWEERMPKGMFLRSGREASHIADPHSALRLDDFERSRGRRVARPTPLADFVEYGHWYQTHAVPDLDGRRVERVTRSEAG